MAGHDAGLPAVASILGIPEDLFRAAIELNDHGFLLLEDTGNRRGQRPRLVYANPAARRLAEGGRDRSAKGTGVAIPALVLEAFPSVIDARATDSRVGFEAAWDRWLHAYSFPATAGMAGIFITDPSALAHPGTELDPGPTAFGDLVIDRDARRVLLRGVPIKLTRTEYELLALLTRSPNRVITRSQVMRSLWDSSWIGSSPALDVHVSRLRNKLGESGASPRFIHSVRGTGLVFIPDPDRPEASASG